VLRRAGSSWLVIAKVQASWDVWHTFGAIRQARTADQCRSRSASTTASLMSARFVAVSSVRVPCLARSRRC
jgi:hypothetical protein